MLLLRWTFTQVWRSNTNLFAFSFDEIESDFLAISLVFLVYAVDELF